MTSHEAPDVEAPDVEAPDVQHPPRRLTQFTTYELRGYRRELESAIAFFDRQDPVPPARDQLQASLDAVVAEQDARSESRGVTWTRIWPTFGGTTAGRTW